MATVIYPDGDRIEIDSGTRRGRAAILDLIFDRHIKGAMIGNIGIVGFGEMEQNIFASGLANEKLYGIAVVLEQSDVEALTAALDELRGNK